MKLKTVATRPYVAALSEGDRSRLIQDRKQSLAPEAATTDIHMKIK
jgi:hypothetical protein